jgi:hypothetical protein
MAEVPTRTCVQCAQAFPATRAHFYPKGANRLDRRCKACHRRRMDAYTAAQKARAAATRTPKPPPRVKNAAMNRNPTGKGLDRALARAPVSLPKAPPPRERTFRDVLRERAQPQWKAIAEALVSRAISGEPSVLKYVGEMLLGDDTAERSDLAEALRELHDLRLAELRQEYGDADAEEPDPGAPGATEALADLPAPGSSGPALVALPRRDG